MILVQYLNHSCLLPAQLLRKVPAKSCAPPERFLCRPCSLPPDEALASLVRGSYNVRAQPPRMNLVHPLNTPCALPVPLLRKVQTRLVHYLYKSCADLAQGSCTTLFRGFYQGCVWNSPPPMGTRPPPHTQACAGNSPPPHQAFPSAGFPNAGFLDFKIP